MALIDTSLKFPNWFNPLFDSLFLGLITWNPLITIIIIVIVTNLILTLIVKYFTDQVQIKSLKDKQKDIRQEINKQKDDPSKVWELNKKSLTHMKDIFMLQKNAILISGIPLLLLFSWFRVTYMDIQLNFLGFIDYWLYAYIILTLIFSAAFRKMLKVH